VKNDPAEDIDTIFLQGLKKPTKSYHDSLYPGIDLNPEPSYAMQELYP
jgi:hypothetical protein